MGGSEEEEEIVSKFLRESGEALLMLFISGTDVIHWFVCIHPVNVWLIQLRWQREHIRVFLMAKLYWPRRRFQSYANLQG